jgi:hypothetical protein
LRCKTAQSSPLSTADFGATAEEDEDDGGGGGPDDDGGSDGNNSAKVSMIAAGIFFSADAGGGEDRSERGAGTGSRAGSGGDAVAAGMMLGSRGGASREEDDGDGASEIAEVSDDEDCDGEEGRDPGNPPSRPDMDFGRGSGTGRRLDASCSEASPSATSDGAGASGPRLFSPSDAVDANPSEAASGFAVAPSLTEAISTSSLRPRERSIRV